MAPSKRYRLVLQTGILIIAIRTALRVTTLPRILGWLSSGKVTAGRDRSTIEDLGYYIDRWLKMFPYNLKGNCFPRSLSLYWFARRAGFPVHFCCGVRKVGAGLDGHAWLMLNSEPFMEPSQHWKTFAVTFRFPHLPSMDPPSAEAQAASGTSRSH